MEKPFMCLCGNVMRLSECSTLIYSQQLGERQQLTVIKYGIKIQSCREASSGIPRRDGPLSSRSIAFSRLTAFTEIHYRTWVKPRAVDQQPVGICLIRASVSWATACIKPSLLSRPLECFRKLGWRRVALEANISNELAHRLSG